MDPAQRLEEYRAANWHFTIGPWTPDFPDIHAYAEPFGRTDTAAAKRVGYSNPDVDAALDAAIAESDPEARAALYAEILTHHHRRCAVPDPLPAGRPETGQQERAGRANPLRLSALPSQRLEVGVAWSSRGGAGSRAADRTPASPPGAAMGFWAFMARRLLLACVVLVIVSVATFRAGHAVPGDPISLDPRRPPGRQPRSPRGARTTLGVR